MIPRLQGMLEELWGLERRRDKLGLEGTRELLAALGDPQQRFRAVHVAGTNGKGSVCAFVERVLRDLGLPVNPSTETFTDLDGVLQRVIQLAARAVGCDFVLVDPLPTDQRPRALIDALLG